MTIELTTLKSVLERVESEIKSRCQSFEFGYEIGDSAGYVVYDADKTYKFEYSSQDVWLQAKDTFSFKHAFEALIFYSNNG